MSSSLFSKAFWEATVERTIRTVAQSGIAYLATGATGLVDIDWASLGSIVGLAAILTVLTCVVASGVGEDGPSLANETTVPVQPGTLLDTDPPTIAAPPEIPYDPKHGNVE